ncbi:MAG: hypothetical protein ACJ766_15825 [Thermoleophilaceae bacterium]
MAISNPGQPDPEVRRLLQELVASQKKTDRWMLTLTVLIAVLTAVAVVVALLG